MEGRPLPQQQLMAWLPRITSLMSWLGSFSIVIDVFRKYRKGGVSKPTIYHRLMAGMAFSDLFFSGALVMTIWPVPAGTPGAYAAGGTEASCKAQAFFLQLGIAQPFYNLCLAIYYYFFIVKNIRPSRVLERCMHFACISLAFGTAIASLALDKFGFAGFWCWFTPEYTQFWYGFWYGPIWVIVCCIAVIMSSIHYNLKKQEKRQRRWKQKFNSNASTTVESLTKGAANNKSGNNTINNLGSTPVHGNIGERSNHQGRQRSIRISDSVKWQAFWYVGSFLLTWFFLTIVRGMEAAGQKDLTPYVLTLAGITLVPIQGFFNYLIYQRPRYKQHRKKFPEVGMFVTFFRISPLFSDFNCCHGEMCTGKRVGSCKRGEEQIIADEPSLRAAPIGDTNASRRRAYLAAMDFNSQEKSDSESDSDESRAEAGQYIHTGA